MTKHIKSKKTRYYAKDCVYNTERVIQGNNDLYKPMEGEHQEKAIEWETSLYYTLNDAHELIGQIGLKNFLESLYHEKKGRLLTVEEHEAMQTLHDSWEL